MIKAVFAATFDPITLGHIDIIERATHLVDELIVAVAINDEKKTFFSADERQLITTEALAHLKKVRVVERKNLTVDIAKEFGATHLIRGIRTTLDLAYEQSMAEMNRMLNPKLDTIWIPSKSAFLHVSSTLVREIARCQGDVSSLVPPLVVRKLSEKLSVSNR